MESAGGPRTGIVTGEATDGLTADGQLLRSTLRDAGHRVDPVRWNDPGVDWEAYDCLIVRSCWEYYTDSEAFKNWIDMVDQADGTVLNRPAVLRWNLHKFYLRDLEQSGVPVVPTRYVDQGSDVSLETILAEAGWTTAVIKPAIGACSHAVWRVRTSIEAAEAQRFRAQAAHSDVLVQQFVPQIADGELSFVFFGKSYSHAYSTRPADEDFRAHPNFGGSVEVCDPAESLVEHASAMIATVGSALPVDTSAIVYARLDGVLRDGDFELLELELIEPHLGLSLDPGAVNRFVDAIETARIQPQAAGQLEGS